MPDGALPIPRAEIGRLLGERGLMSAAALDNAAGGECNYTTLPTYPPPGMGECTVPDWVPK